MYFLLLMSVVDRAGPWWQRSAVLLLGIAILVVSAAGAVWTVTVLTDLLEPFRGSLPGGSGAS